MEHEMIWYQWIFLAIVLGSLGYFIYRFRTRPNKSVGVGGVARDIFNDIRQIF